MNISIKFAKRYCKILSSINLEIKENYPVFNFIYCIVSFALENNAAFNALLKNKHKLSPIHFIRMQVDCCLEVYACLLYKDKSKFLRNFMDGNPINRLSIGKQYLTTGYLCGELDKRYSGILSIYKEGCKWIHPNKVIFRYNAPECDYDNEDMFLIGYKGNHYYEDKVQLNDIYKDMLLINQILHELIKELADFYKDSRKDATKTVSIGQFYKFKKKIKTVPYE